MAAARKGFKKQNDEALKEAYDQAEAESGDGGPRVKLREGMNVWAVFPAFGEMKTFIERVKVHYSPFHVCGRRGLVRNPEDPTKFADDRKFANCARCIGASDAWKDAGHPGKGDPESKDEHKQKFKDDMPSDAGIVQVVDLTPFFTMKGRNPVFNSKTADHLENYLKAVNGDEEALEALPNDELKEPAKAGFSQIVLNKDLTDALENAEYETREAFAKRAKTNKDLKEIAEEGPLLHPESFLVYIDRQKDMSKGFTNKQGQTNHPRVYTAKYLTIDDLIDNWTEVLTEDLQDLLWTAAGEKALDLSAPDLGPDADLTTRARGFARLDDDEMLAYLKEAGHSFSASASSNASAPAAAKQAEDGEQAGLDMNDPDNFDTEGAEEIVASAKSKEAIAKARARTKRKAAAADEEEE